MIGADPSRHAAKTALDALRQGGKPAMARALTEIESRSGTPSIAAFLDAAAGAPRGHVLGITGPPGVGKSTLTDRLIRQARCEGRTVAVIAVDPSSQISGGALLGDRTRLKTDPEDQGVFVRSMAARDRLGGLSDNALAAVVLMRAVYDLVIVESVGIGQSESDIAHIADTVLLCIQPGSGDALQFMKAGVMELPDVVVVTKADIGAAAERARADVAGALGLARADRTSWSVPVVAVSSVSGVGFDRLEAALSAHMVFANETARRQKRHRSQERHLVIDAIRRRYGEAGLGRAGIDQALGEVDGPFLALAAILADLDRHWRS